MKAWKKAGSDSQDYFKAMSVEAHGSIRGKLAFAHEHTQCVLKYICV